MDFLQKLKSERIYCDGGTGSLLQKMGLKAGELPELWNLTHKDEMVSVAKSYYDAGSNIVNTNTFGANRLKYGDRLEEIVKSAVENVKTARERSDNPGDKYVALDIGPSGKLLQPMGDLSFDDAVELFAEVVRYGSDAGADLILIETMSDTYEAKAAVLAAKENSDLPVCVTVTFDEKGKLLTGGDVDCVVALLEGLGVDALGLNCGLGPQAMVPLVKRMLEVSSLPVIVNPNAGLPRVQDGVTVYDVSPKEFAGHMTEIAKLGAHIMGGCCGTTPDHISKMIEMTKDEKYTPPVKKDLTVVSSFSKCVYIGDSPVVIGERINPTGKKRFKEALKNRDMEYILSQGIEQEESGAEILDVNVGLPEIDESFMMREVMTKLQAVSYLPLQLDTSDPKALEEGLRHYNGKAMINSVNGKRESIESVFPLVKKYGGVVVGLLLDESGIPDNSEERINIAKKIYAAADEYGIDRKDIVFDGLAMAVSSDSKGALVTLDTIRRIKSELKGNSILGVSNISFGLPRREIINSTFLIMAMQEGLSCAIINPNNELMMRAIRAYCALSDKDSQFKEYINAYAGTQDDSVQSVKKADTVTDDPEGKQSLFMCVEKGLTEKAGELAKELIKTKSAMEIVDSELIPALDSVGKRFEKGELFLPQLLTAAEAAQTAFSVIRESMSGSSETKKGRLILATVKNDIHDIGKNIVKVMLENYGYDVIDLGKDVAPEEIVDCAIKEDIKLVGLSALMTTTVVSMEKTIKLLKEKKPDTKVMVGGAVMTEDYAQQIGADSYSKDAMGAVRYADTVFQKGV